MMRRFFVGLMLFLSLSACLQDGEQGPTAVPPTPGNASAAVFPTTTSPAAAPTLPPAPTPIVPMISVADQPLGETGRLQITSVSSPVTGWIVIYATEGTSAGNVLGVAPVEPGDQTNINITIDPLLASPTLSAQLHEDNGQAGVFEFPGPDGSLKAESAVVSQDFNVEITLPMPSITIVDQEIGQDGLLQIERGLLLDPTWLVILGDNQSEAGPIVGQILLQPGRIENLSMPIRWRDATPQLTAVLVEDQETPTQFDYPEIDLPLLVNNTPVVANFSVTMPLDVVVFDQPVVNGQIVIERVVSNGPGWLAVYYDVDGETGLIIGFKALQNGVNEQIKVDLVETAVTLQLYILLHTDESPFGEFDFPGGDPPITEAGLLPAPFVLRTDIGNYLITRDQSLNAAAEITIPLVVADINTWVVVFSDEDGEPSKVIGQTFLSAGLHHDVKVTVDMQQATETLFASLHQDSGELKTFDFADGEDIPLQRNHAPIRSPFTILEIGD